MKSLIAERAKIKQEQIKETAEENKKLVAKSKNKLKQDQPKQAKQGKIEVAPETQTVMLDIK